MAIWLRQEARNTASHQSSAIGRLPVTYARPRLFFCYVDGEWPGGARGRDVPAARWKGAAPFPYGNLQLGHQRSAQDHGDSSHCGALATIPLGRDAISELALHFLEPSFT